MVFAAIVRVVEAVPDLDLHADAAFGGFDEHEFETLPIGVVPIGEIESAIRQLLERIQLETLVLPVAHGIADDVAAGGGQTIELGNQLLRRPLKQVVVIAAAHKQDGFPLVAQYQGLSGQGSRDESAEARWGAPREIAKHVVRTANRAGS